MNDRDYRQTRIHEWGARAFGRDHMNDPVVRAARFLEEACEFAQAAGLSEGHALRALAHVYARPAGNPAQEAGGVGLTLLALCTALGLSADLCERDELARVESLPPDHFARRNAVKVALIDEVRK
jgi:hypothetical protein